MECSTAEVPKFETIAEDYSEQHCKGRFCTDFPTAIVEFVAKGKSHKVSMSDQECKACLGLK